MSFVAWLIALATGLKSKREILLSLRERVWTRCCCHLKYVRTYSTLTLASVLGVALPNLSKITAVLFRSLPLFAFVFLLNAPLIAASGGPSATGQPLYQLRIYEIFENNKASFHDRFRDHAIRIMKKYDFSIVAMWEARSDTRTEFVYVLQWPDEATKTDRWARFMADQKWADIKRESAARHGRMVGEIQDRIIRLTDYSPRLP